MGTYNEKKINMKNYIPSFEEFLNENLNESSSNDYPGPKFVEEFLTKKSESFKDIRDFYAYMRETIPLRWKTAQMSYDDARSLEAQASKKYPDYEMSTVVGDRRPIDCQVWVSVHKAIRQVPVYNILLCHATSMSDIDSMIRDFESTIKKLDR